MTRLDEAKKAFHDEAHALLEQMEDALLRLESNPWDNDLIESVFRAAQTIRGTGAVFGFDQLEGFVRETERALDLIRGGIYQLEQKPVALLLACRDHVTVLVNSAVFEHALEQAHVTTHATLLRQLSEYQNGDRITSARSESPCAPILKPQHPGDHDSRWQIFVEFSPDVMRKGMDPIYFLQKLHSVGRLFSVVTSFHTMPPVEQMNPDSCYVSYEIILESTTATKTSIENVFDLVREDVMISILPPADQIGDMIDAIEQMPEDVGVLGDMLARAGSITPNELQRALSEQQRLRDTGRNAQSIPRLGQLLVNNKVVRPELVDAAVEKQRRSKTKNKPGTLRLNVDADTVDQIIHLAAELSIAGADARQFALEDGNGQLVESLLFMAELAKAIGERALQLRSE